MTLTNGYDDRLYTAVMDFVRIIKNDETFDELLKQPKRRRAILEGHAKTVAQYYEIEAADLMKTTGKMLAGVHGISVEDFTSSDELAPSP